MSTGGGWDTGKGPLVVSTASATYCGRCSHPMHWHECGQGAEPCRCRNDGAAFSGFASTEDRTGLDVERLAPLIDEVYQRGLDAPEAAPFIAAAYGAYLCPHDLDLRIHARCYLCEPEPAVEP